MRSQVGHRRRADSPERPFRSPAEYDEVELTTSFLRLAPRSSITYLLQSTAMAYRTATSALARPTGRLILGSSGRRAAIANSAASKNIVNSNRESGSTVTVSSSSSSSPSSLVAGFFNRGSRGLHTSARALIGQCKRWFRI